MLPRNKRIEVLGVVLVVVLIFVLRILPISYGDLYSDNAINSFRAYGWFDYLGMSGQSGPFEWLGHIPSWALLSFHDAPPLGFLVQHMFFSLFGDSVVVVRLPFVLAGIVSVFLVYFLLKKLSDRKTASIAILFYAISSYAVWAGQAGYLEGLQELFIVGSLLFGGIFLFQNQHKKYIYIWALFMVGALLTKYTAIFMIPPILVYAFLYKNTFKQHWRHILVGVILMVILFSPVIVYNLHVYGLRGHFDAALSSMVGMHPEDFKIISDRSASANPLPNMVNIFSILERSVSYPFLILFVFSLFVLLWDMKKRGLKTFESWVVVNLIFLFLMFSFAGVAVRFLSIFVPFLVIVIALGIRHIQEINKNIKIKQIVWGIVVSVFVFELFYSFNTHVLVPSVGSIGVWYSTNKVKNLGFNELDDFVRDNIIVKLPEKQTIRKAEDIVFSSKEIKDKSVIVFDDRIIWFAQMWYTQRYFLYHKWPFISTSYFSPSNANKLDINEIMKVSGKPLYFVYPIHESVFDSVRSKDEQLNVIGPSLAKYLDSIKTEFTIIKNKLGVPVFKIYKINSLL